MTKLASLWNNHRFTILSWMVTFVLVASLLGGALWWKNARAASAFAPVPTAGPNNDAGPVVTLPLPPVSGAIPSVGRHIQLYTNIPADLPRYEPVMYTVQRGEAVSRIAEKFGVTLESILYNNKDVFDDNPDTILKPGVILVIPPVDGLYYIWQTGDTLEAIAAKFKANVNDILEFPGNEIDLVNPDDIKSGTMLMIPGGSRELKNWSQLIAEETNQGGGSSACGGGPVGSLSFMWPTYGPHTLSGSNFSAGHQGIDISAGEGDAVLAADTGTVVFQGWSQYGYGYMVKIDHNNGFETLYAHLSNIFVSMCQNVTQGMQIGAAGNTGNSFGAHLHFEIHLGGVSVNPWDYIQ